MDLLEAIAVGVQSKDQREGRVYGPLYGSVTDINDPGKLNRVKVRFGAQGDNESSDWALPAFPGGIESIPRKGDPCVVWFIDGDTSRPVYACYQKSTTTNRPTEHIILGDSAMALLNNIIDEINTLKSDFNTFKSGAFTTHTHAGVTVGAGVTGVTSTVTTPTTLAFGKALDANGSTIGSSISDKIVLSANAKVR
jgi:hypothetical protein